MARAVLDHEKLQKAIAANKLTQEELAEELGISDRHLRNLKARDTDISVSLCYSMSKTFGVPMEELLKVPEREERVE